MAWIESHDDIGDHKKTQKLCSTLKIPVPTAVGHLHLLWHYTLRVAWQTGDLSGHLPAFIARGCHWTGKPELFLKALQSSGYMDGMKVHDWEVYARELIYQRSYNRNKRNTAVKQVKNSCSTAKSSPLPNPTLPNPTLKDKPSLKMVRDYFASLGYPNEAEAFYDHYEANGWRIGGIAQIYSWPALCRKWLRNPKMQKAKTSTQKFKDGIKKDAQDLEQWEEMKNGKTNTCDRNKLLATSIPEIGN